jgi:hypothetical protein
MRQIVSMPEPGTPETIDATVVDALRRRPPGAHVLVYLDHSTLSSLALGETGFPPLLRLLRKAVETDRLVCAYSPEHRDESVLAQPSSYEAIEQLADELSIGVMMRQRKDIEWREINAAASAFLGHPPEPVWVEAFRDGPHTPRADRFVSVFGGKVRVKVRFDVEEWQRDEVRNQKGREHPMVDAYEELRAAGYTFEELAEANFDAMLKWKLGPMFDAANFQTLLEERAEAAADPSLTADEQSRAFLRFSAFEQIVTGTLEQSERSADAASAIRALADASAIGERNAILEPIARGLDRHGLADLAALAYTLAWTRTRGGGGWLTFGGKDNLDLLRRASVLSPEVAIEAVLSEIQHAVSFPRYGTHGVGQAMIFAIADSAIPAPPGTTGTELAFRTWDAAFGVISSRAPRVAASDDPEWPYTPSEAVGTPGTAELESSFALAVIGCLAAPARETKRRALLAVEQLLSDAPGALAEGLPHALGAISDAPTLTWLLATIARHPNARIACRDSEPLLERLTRSDRLTVRAMARSLVDEAPALPSSTVQPARHAAAGDDRLRTRGKWLARPSSSSPA